MPDFVWTRTNLASTTGASNSGRVHFNTTQPLFTMTINTDGSYTIDVNDEYYSNFVDVKDVAKGDERKEPIEEFDTTEIDNYIEMLEKNMGTIG